MSDRILVMSERLGASSKSVDLWTAIHGIGAAGARYIDHLPRAFTCRKAA